MSESANPVSSPVDGGMNPICDDLRAETDDLLAILDGLTDADWDRPTPAVGWSVRDQISHLAFFDETGTLAATDPDAFAASTKELMRSSGPDTAGLGRGRAMSPGELLEWFTTVRARMIDVFRVMDKKTRLPWYGPAMGALSFATARLMETWAHGQDIADTFAIERTPTARLKHVAHIGIGARPFSYVTNGREVPEGLVAVTLRPPGSNEARPDPAPGSNGEMWAWNESATENSVRGDALDFCLVVTQRRNVADTSLVVAGPLAHDWIGIAQAFAGGPGVGRQPGQFS